MVRKIPLTIIILIIIIRIRVVVVVVVVIQVGQVIVVVPELLFPSFGNSIQTVRECINEHTDGISQHGVGMGPKHGHGPLQHGKGKEGPKGQHEQLLIIGHSSDDSCSSSWLLLLLLLLYR